MANYDVKTVYVFSDVLDEIRKFRRYSTGKAYLFGQWTSSFNPVVHGIYLESNGLSNFKFESQPANVEDVKKQLKNNFLLSNIGEVVVTGSSADRSQDLSGNVNAPGRLILKVSQSSNDLQALLYSTSSFRPLDCRIDALRGENPFSLVRVKKNIVGYRREDHRFERSEVGHQYGHRARRIDDRSEEGGFGQYDYRKPVANTYAHPVSGELSNLAAKTRTRNESEVEEAEIRREQWYASSEGQKILKALQEGVKDIASDCKVNMKRDKETHDLSFTFKYYTAEWELVFPSSFPSRFLKLKKIGDRSSLILITEQSTREILNKIKDELRQNSFK